MISTQFRFAIFKDDDTYLPLLHDGFEPDKWYHIAGTYDQSTGEQRLYVNGLLVEHRNVGSITIQKSERPLTVGCYWGTDPYDCNVTRNYFDGTIDEVRVWNKARTEEEIRAAMCQKLRGNEPGLVAYYRFDEGPGSSATTDLTGNVDGTLVNMDLTTARIFSEAPIGDTSTYRYTNNWAAQQLRLSSATGEQFAVGNITDSPLGIHLYRVDTLPNRLPATTDSLPASYYGAFAIEGNPALYDVTINPGAASEMLPCRRDTLTLYQRLHNADAWRLSNFTTLETGSKTQVKREQVRGEYIVTRNFVTLATDTLVRTTSYAICEGDSMVLKAPLGRAYRWNTGDTLPQITVSSPGIYVVEAQLEAGCATRDTFNLQVQPVPQLNLGDDLIYLCADDNLTLVAGSGDLSYQWQDGSGAATYVVREAGLYWVEVRQHGCSRRDSVQVIYAAPHGDFFKEDTLRLCQGETYRLRATLPGASYRWQDGSRDSTLTVDEAGLYWVTVSTTHCTYRDSVQVEIQSAKDLLVPNVFTPNGDKVNEFFELGKAWLGSRLWIYNRWGKEVYYSAAYDNSWNGGKLPAGVYFCRIEPILPTCGQKMVKSWLEIFR